MAEKTTFPYTIEQLCALLDRNHDCLTELATLELEPEIKQRMQRAYERENNYYRDMAKQIIATYGIKDRMLELVKD